MDGSPVLPLGAPGVGREGERADATAPGRAGVRWNPPVPRTTWTRQHGVAPMPGPLSPLFEDLYLERGLPGSIRALAGALRVVGLLDAVARPPYLRTVHGHAFLRTDLRIGPVTALRMLLAGLTAPFRLRPALEYWRERLASYRATLARWRHVDPAAAADLELLMGVRALALADARYWCAAGAAVRAVGAVEWVLEHLVAPRAGRGRLLGGFDTPLRAADAELDAVARRILEVPELHRALAGVPADRLPDALPDTADGRAVRAAVERFVERHGHLFHDLDFASAPVAEAPLPVWSGLLLRVRAVGPDVAAHQVAVARERDRLADEVDRGLDPVRQRLFRRFLAGAQRLSPTRERALYTVGAGWPTLRRLALELGRRLAARGALADPADVFFLKNEELVRAIEDRSTPGDWAAVAQERRRLRVTRQELRPPLAIPAPARGPGGRVLRGVPVAAGRATGRAVVVRTPEDAARMVPGAIVVCPFPAPAWTPLLPRARGLVADLGGVLAQAVRGYGIPVVVGTGDATRRIGTGEAIAVDGTAGTVTRVGERSD